MTAHSIQPKWWQAVRRWLGGTVPPPERWDCSRRVRIQEADAFTVPQGTRRLRVVSGGAWVSYLREDLILREGQVLHLHPSRQSVVVTAMGRQPLELEIYR